jgi:hypothetical protein
MITTKEVTNNSKMDGNDDSGCVVGFHVLQLQTEPAKRSIIGCKQKALFPPDYQYKPFSGNLFTFG